MTIESITDALVEMMQMLQDRKLHMLTHSIAGFNVSLTRFEGIEDKIYKAKLRWNVDNELASSDALEVAEFIHAKQK